MRADLQAPLQAAAGGERAHQGERGVGRRVHQGAPDSRHSHKLAQHGVGRHIDGPEEIRLCIMKSSKDESGSSRVGWSYPADPHHYQQLVLSSMARSDVGRYGRRDVCCDAGCRCSRVAPVPAGTLAWSSCTWSSRPGYPACRLSMQAVML